MDNQTEREAFEAGINPHCRKRNEHGDYVVPEIQDRWDGFQAAAAWQREQVNGLVEALENLCACIMETRGANADNALFEAKQALATYKAQDGK